jgi:lipoprotein-anchoring transpeptidase ErfK/SrfK
VQTLKTAIVVVLLLTVTYSAYVTMTAPPAELPSGIASILEDGEAQTGFDLDDIDVGTTMEFNSDLPDDLTLPPPLGAEGTDGSNAGIDPTLPPPSGLASTPSPAEDPAASLRMSDEAAAPATDTAVPAAVVLPPSDLNFADSSSSPTAPSSSTGDTSTTLPPPAGDSLAGGFNVPSLDATPGPSEPAANPAPAAPPGSADSGATGPAITADSTALVNALATADRQSSQQQLREALTTLSLFYNTPEMTSEQREALLARLDYLAGEVVYSPRHLLEQPHRVRQGETLETIAASLNVPWQLLATINQIQDPAAIAPGSELKVLKGPFRAEVNLNRSELTLFLGELYAGRFPIQTGNDPAPVPGSYSVLAKQSERTYYPLSGANIPAGDPRNPYGDMWLDLGNQMCIHGSPQQPTANPAGCIQLRPSDARDVFGILSQGSSVSITR